MTQDNITYERRKFTLTSNISHQIDELAKDHTGGNASQLVRSSIKDHARTLEDRDEFELKKLQREIQQTTEKVDVLIDSLNDESRPQPPTSQSEPAKSENKEVENIAIQRQVQRIMLDSAENAISFRELSNRTDSEPLEVQNAVESLLEKGYLQKKSTGKLVRYQICAP